MLQKKLGLRIVEIADGKQVRLEELLKKLPSRGYEKPEAVIDEIIRRDLL